MTELKDNYPLWNVIYRVNGNTKEYKATVGGHESDIERLLHEAHAEPIHSIIKKGVDPSAAVTSVQAVYPRIASKRKGARR